MKKEVISGNVVARLPQYYRCVDDLYHTNCIRISSSTLSGLLGFTAAQIRQDLSHFGEFGQQGYGYNVRKLRFEIREILGMNSHNTCILVGCGHLGHALLSGFDFQTCGFYMLKAFDTDVESTRTSVNGIKVLPVEQLEAAILEDRPCMAVLTVPQTAAQTAADQLFALGITAIWNFTGASIKTPSPEVIVENVNFSDSLLKLSYRINELRDEETF